MFIIFQGERIFNDNLRSSEASGRTLSGLLSIEPKLRIQDSSQIVHDNNNENNEKSEENDAELGTGRKTRLFYSTRSIPNELIPSLPHDEVEDEDEDEKMNEELRESRGTGSECDGNHKEGLIRPHALYCIKFQTCVHGKLVEETCGPGTNFNPLDKVRNQNKQTKKCESCVEY